MHRDTTCPTHNGHAGKHCLNCQIALCTQCDRIDINGRPWCLSCGRDKVPGAKDALSGLALLLAKIAAVCVPGLLAFLFLPGLFIRLIGTVIIMTIIARFVFVRDSLGPTRVEEFRNGVMVKTY